MLEQLATRVCQTDFSEEIVTILWDRKTDECELEIVSEDKRRSIKHLDRETASEMFRHPWLVDIKLSSTLLET